MKKINQLILGWKKGTVKTTKELNKFGYSSQILKVYSNSGWIELFGRGAYKLAGDDIGWQGGLYCLQQQSNLFIHVGGKTALELNGFSHYLIQKPKIELFGQVTDNLPFWFTSKLMTKDISLFKTNLFSYKKPMFSTFNDLNIPLYISKPELAILEMIYLVPATHSIEDTNLIMESLTMLRSDFLQKLLEMCNSIKTKRLFLYLAERHNYDWFKELNLTNIDIGSGKREIVKNGKLNKKYNITIPKNYYE